MFLAGVPGSEEENHDRHTATHQVCAAVFIYNIVSKNIKNTNVRLHSLIVLFNLYI